MAEASARPGPLLEVRDLDVRYGALQALAGVSFDLARGETLAVVGESGSGKSTLARALAGLLPARSGSLRFDGIALPALRPRAWRPLRRRLQLVFQDPSASLDPRLRVGAIVAEPLAIHRLAPRGARGARVAELLGRVGLAPDFAGRWPHQLSGGERQRVGIARALATEPELILLDEPVSSLDVSVQAQILNLLADLREQRGLAYLLISHHLGVVRQLADRVAVLFAGRLVEVAPVERLLAHPLHPYTRALLAAAPRGLAGRAGPSAPVRAPQFAPVGATQSAPVGATQSAPARATRRGGGPPLDPGCAYRTRCPLAIARCAEERPRAEAPETGREVACHRAGELPPPAPQRTLPVRR